MTAYAIYTSCAVDQNILVNSVTDITHQVSQNGITAHYPAPRIVSPNGSPLGVQIGCHLICATAGTHLLSVAETRAASSAYL